MFPIIWNSKTSQQLPFFATQSRSDSNKTAESTKIRCDNVHDNCPQTRYMNQSGGSHPSGKSDKLYSDIVKGTSDKKGRQSWKVSGRKQTGNNTGKRQQFNSEGGQ